MDREENEDRGLLCQCLAAISMADDDLDSREIATQISIIEQITGVAPTADEIVTASIEMGDWQDFIDVVQSRSASLSDEFRTRILQACILIGRADDSMSDVEGERIYKIAECLGFERDQVVQQLKIIR